MPAAWYWTSQPAKLCTNTFLFSTNDPSMVFCYSSTKLTKTSARHHNWPCKHLSTLLQRRHSVLLIGQNVKLLFIIIETHQLWSGLPLLQNEGHRHRKWPCLRQHTASIPIPTNDWQKGIHEGFKIWNETVSHFWEAAEGTQLLRDGKSFTIQPTYCSYCQGQTKHQ